MKSIVADFATRIMCLRIVPVSGDVIRLVQYPRNVLMGNGETYLCGSGFQFTSVTISTTATPGVVDFEGILGQAGLDRDKVLSGLFDNARAYLFATSWTAPVEDEEPITASILGKVTIIDNRIRIEEMSLIDALGQQVSKTYTPQCPKIFGSQGYAQCMFDVESLRVTGSVTSVINKFGIGDSSRSESADYFNNGFLTFTSGNNAGLPGQEVRSYTASKRIMFYEPFYYLPQVGDSYSLIPGCPKTLAACKTFNNIVNFGGFSFIPNSSTYARGGL